MEFVGGFIVTALIFPLIIVGAGGNWRWVEGWLFALWYGGLLLLPALYFIQRATLENTYLSTLPDPGRSRSTRDLVGSLRAGLVLTALGVVGLAARIVGEERMLRAELKGYAEYQQKVRVPPHSLYLVTRARALPLARVWVTVSSAFGSRRADPSKSAVNLGGWNERSIPCCRRRFPGRPTADRRFRNGSDAPVPTTADA